MFKSALIASSILALSGCALLSSNTTVQLAVEGGIDAGVGIILAKNPAEAAPLAAAATALESLASGSSTTVATLVTDADNTIAKLPGLNAPEKLALEDIVTLAASTLSIGQNALSPTTKFDLTLVFTDIANAADIFAVSNAKAARLHR